MKKQIDAFIEKQACTSICYVDEKIQPDCFTCFYSYDADETLLHYKSRGDTHHSTLLLKKPMVAGTILPDKLNFLKIKGVQFKGVVLSNEHPLTKNASDHYYRKHPIALTMAGEIRTILIHSIKFTDNTLGFGTKLNWKRVENRNNYSFDNLLNKI